MADSGATLVVDRYQLLNQLGRTPWYRQYLASDLKRGETVIVKALQLVSPPPDRLDAFRQWYTESLHGAPGAIPVRALHLQGDQLYVIEMPPEGQPWRNWVGHKPSAASMLPKVLALLERLEGLHAHGIRHNCFLPENLWWHPDRGWNVADCGWLRWCLQNGYIPANSPLPEAWTAMADGHQIAALIASTLLGDEMAADDFPLRATAELKRRARHLPEPWPSCFLQLWGPAVTEDWSPMSAARQVLAGQRPVTRPMTGPVSVDLPITGSIASAAALSAGESTRANPPVIPLPIMVPVTEPMPMSPRETTGARTPISLPAVDPHDALDPKFRRAESTKYAKIVFATLLLTIAFAVGVLIAMSNFLFKATIAPSKVPDITGLTVTAAKKAAEPVGFTVTISRAEYSPEVPQDKIISQSPDAGTTVKELREIYVTISRGARSIKLPTLIGLTEDSAKESLVNLALKVGTVQYEYAQDIPAGKVIDQSPAANTLLAKEEPVSLVVSRGVLKGELIMPKLTNMGLAKAAQVVGSAKLRIRKIVRRYDYDALTSTVALQAPSAGTRVEEGDGVFLTVVAPKSQEPLGEFKIRIVMELPPFEGKKSASIVVHDGRGERVEYQSDHAGGDRIEKLIDAYQTTQIKVLVDGQVVREEQY